MTGDTEPDAVVVAYAHDGREVKYSWHKSMIELVGHDLVTHARVLRGGYIAMLCETGNLVKARNDTIKTFLEENLAPWLFWVDTDMGFPADVIERLIEVADPVERPVVGCLAFTQRQEANDGLGGWRCVPTPTIFDYGKDGDKSGFIVRFDYVTDQLQRCAGTGSAGILIHRSALEKVKERFGETWYDLVPNKDMGRMISEDLSFCVRLGAVGIPVHVHAGVKMTHLKPIWLAEDDYFAHVALSRLVPPVPPANERTAIIVPVLGRPENAQPFMESLAASGADLANVLAIANDSDWKTYDAWRKAGANITTISEEYLGTFAEKVNAGYLLTPDDPWLFIVGDDVRFHPGWLDQAQAVARDGFDVIGTNDLHNPRVMAGEHGTHLLIRRSYVEEQGASWDGPGLVCHEGYRHNFVDDEIVAVAKQRDTWASAKYAKVEHLHPIWGNAETDDTYRLGQASFEADKKLFETRSSDHAAV